MLKVFRTERQLVAQVEALRAFGEDRAVRVLDARLAERAILLERVKPGTTLASAESEDDAMQVVARLLAPRWPAVPEGCAATPLADVARALDGAGVARARAICAELLTDPVQPVLLHGDMHYENILVSDRAGHLLIDPKGVIGDPAFDIGYLVSRPMPSARDALPLPDAIDRRLAFLPDATGLDAQRVASFAYVTAALSVVWAREDRDSSLPMFEEAMRLLERRSPL